MYSIPLTTHIVMVNEADMRKLLYYASMADMLELPKRTYVGM